MSTYQPTLGAYEQQVLLELDKQVTLAQSHWIRAKDPSLRNVFGLIEFYYGLGIDHFNCSNGILIYYGLPTNECALVDVAGVAEVGYN